MQPQLQVANLACLAIANQPRVRIAAIVALAHDRRVLIDRRRILHRLARPLELRNPLHIEALGHRQRGLGNHQPAGVHAKVVRAGNHARQPIHQEVLTLLRNDVEHHGPTFALRVGGPVAMRDHDLPIPGRGPRRNERATLPRRHSRWRIRPLLLRIQHRQVVFAQLNIAIQRDDIPQIQRRSMRLQPFDDALQLRLVLRIELRPQHRLSRLAKETPRTLIRMRSRDRIHLHVVLNLARQQIPMLEPNLLRRSSQVHIRPSPLVELIAAIETWVGRRCR